MSSLGHVRHFSREYRNRRGRSCSGRSFQIMLDKAENRLRAIVLRQLAQVICEGTIALVEFVKMRGMLHNRAHVTEPRQMMQRLDFIRRRSDQRPRHYRWRASYSVAPFEIQQ